MNNKNKEKTAHEKLQLSWKRSFGIREVVVFFVGLAVGFSAILFA